VLKKEAERITGGLSAPGKMPEGSYNLPAAACQTGAKLRLVPDTPCYKCYAFKGNYVRFPAVQKAMYRRLASLTHPQWAEGMTTLIKKIKHFRWHDSGDIQSVQHLKNIYEVCVRTPATMHWLPTQERKYLPLPGSTYPKNLLIRLSNSKNNSKPGNAWSHWSTVVDSGGDCPASRQGNQCGSCRRCWNPKVKHVTYPKH
jgi:hypothetical protein